MLKGLRRVYETSDSELLAIWNSFKNVMWNSETMYDDELTMDEYAMHVYSELGARGISVV